MPHLFFLTCFALCFSSLGTVAHANEDFRNVEDVLVFEHGWQRDHIGPTGMSYTIDMDAQSRAVLTLHPIIQQRTTTKKSTPICSLFKPGRQFFFSRTVKNGYSEKKALDARQRYIFQGDNAVNDADWLQIDKYNWISYINEGLYSHQSCAPDQPCGHVADMYYDLPFTIQSCHATTMIAQTGSLTFTFPNLILTMPEYLFLSASLSSSASTSQNNGTESMAETLRKLEEMALKAGAQMAPGVEWLFSQPNFSKSDQNRFLKEMYNGDVSPEHLIMMGQLCEYVGREGCGQLLMEAYNYGDMSEYFTVVERMLQQ